MKHTVLFAALGLVGFSAAAQEVGRVISAVPVVQQVQVPRQVCTNQPVVVQNAPTGGGAIIGGIAGAGIGNQIGHGSGRAAATLVGLVGGALLGNSVEANAGRHVQNVAQCNTQVSYENRTVAYNVTYEYAGRQFTTQMAQDPGPTIQLQVSPVGGNYTQPPERAIAQGDIAPGPVVVAPEIQQPAAAPPVTVAPATVYSAPAPVYSSPAPVYSSPAPVYSSPAPVYAAPAPVYTYPAPPVYSAYPAYPVYPAYRPYYRPYYPPISLNLGYVYHGGGKGGHRGGRWR